MALRDREKLPGMPEYPSDHIQTCMTYPEYLDNDDVVGVPLQHRPSPRYFSRREKKYILVPDCWLYCDQVH